MRKLLLSFISLLSLNLMAQSSLVLENLQTGNWGSVAQDIEVHAHVRNNSDGTKRYMVAREILQSQGNAQHFFCWTQCYPPATDTSDTYIQLNAGESTNLFKAYYRPNGNTGVGIARYTFYNTSDPSDSLKITVSFDAYPLGTEQVKVSTEISAFPNPANEFFALNYQLPDTRNYTIEIQNLLGKIVQTVVPETAKGSIAINTRDFTEGLYFYTLKQNGKMIRSGRMVVRH